MITGTCGAGKSTMKDTLAEMLDPKRYACVDSDETGLNWWDYAGTDRETRYGADTLKAHGSFGLQLSVNGEHLCHSGIATARKAHLFTDGSQQLELLNGGRHQRLVNACSDILLHVRFCAAKEEN